MDQRWDHIVRDVIALPLRIGRRGTSLGITVVGAVAGMGVRAVGRLVGPANRGPDRGAVEDEEVSGDARVDIAVPTPETPAAPPPPVEAEAAEQPDTAPAHVSEEPELVESYADPGAEDGPGASVHVEEPWPGYGHMTADDVVARLAAASREEIAAVELYERLHRGRRTVLTAAGRELRRASVPGRKDR
jgi:hypothetical protein